MYHNSHPSQVVALESRFSGLVNKVGNMESSQYAIVGLLGLIIVVLLNIIFLIYREVRKREWERRMEERLGLGEQPRAESCRIVFQGQVWKACMIREVGEVSGKKDPGKWKIRMRRTRYRL